jgi:hypothetical protein
VGVQTKTVSRLLLGSPGIKNHLDVGAVERHKEYYMGEGGGFPRVRAVVNLVSPESPVACPNTKGAPESVLTNLLVRWMQIRMSNQKLITLPSPAPPPLYPFYKTFVKLCHPIEYLNMLGILRWWHVYYCLYFIWI